MSLKHKIHRVTAPVKRALLSNYKLNHKGQGVIGFIDIGSMGGLPTPWAENANKIRMLLNFEPNSTPKKGRNYVTSSDALWKEEATLPFHISRMNRGVGSSLFEQNVKYVDQHWAELSLLGPRKLSKSWHKRSAVERIIDLRCKRLDDVIENLDLDHSFNFIKCDAQGAEFEILLGAKNVLADSCVGLHLELFSIPLYKGITLAADVIQFLETQGFVLEYKFPAHGTFDSQNDCLFIKPTGDKAALDVIRSVYGLA